MNSTASREFVSILAACEEGKHAVKPKKFGYFRLHIDTDGSIFLSFGAADPAVKPIATNLNIDMTIREAIGHIGSDGLRIMDWLFDAVDIGDQAS